MSYQTCAFDDQKTCGYNCPMFTVSGCKIREACYDAGRMRVTLERMERTLDTMSRVLARIENGTAESARA